MSNYVNVNTECQTSEPRQNIGIGSIQNKYKMVFWYRNPEGKMSSLVTYANELQVYDRQTNRLVKIQELMEIVEVRPDY